MWREKNIYFIEPDIDFTKLMFILKNINLELKSALRTKYLFVQSLLYVCTAPWHKTSHCTTVRPNTKGTLFLRYLPMSLLS